MAHETDLQGVMKTASGSMPISEHEFAHAKFVAKSTIEQSECLLDRLWQHEEDYRLANDEQDRVRDMRHVLLPFVKGHNRLLDFLRPLFSPYDLIVEKRARFDEKLVDIGSEADDEEMRLDARSPTLSAQRDLSPEGEDSGDEGDSEDNGDESESVEKGNGIENEESGDESGSEDTDNEGTNSASANCDRIKEDDDDNRGSEHSESEEHDSQAEESQTQDKEDDRASLSDSNATETAPSDWFDEEGDTDIVDDSTAPYGAIGKAPKHVYPIDPINMYSLEVQAPEDHRETRAKFVERNIRRCRRSSRQSLAFDPETSQSSSDDDENDSADEGDSSEQPVVQDEKTEEDGSGGTDTRFKSDKESCAETENCIRVLPPNSAKGEWSPVQKPRRGLVKLGYPSINPRGPTKSKAEDFPKVEYPVSKRRKRETTVIKPRRCEENSRAKLHAKQKSRSSKIREDPVDLAI